MLRLALLLRGINVGKAKQVPMADLRALLSEEGGYGDVATLLRSGNVALSAAGDAEPAAVAADAERLIEARFGFAVRVLARTAAELSAVVAADPFDGAATDGSRRLVIFLEREPDATALAALTQADFGAERVAAAGRQLHVWCPDGQTGSPVMDAIGHAGLDAGTVTVRNWNTVTKLAALTGPPPGRG